jgi:hypothetical protein
MVVLRVGAVEFARKYIIFYLNCYYKSRYVPLKEGTYLGSCSLVIVMQAHYKASSTPWLWSASELYRPSDRRLLAKLVSTFADRGVSCSQRHGSLLP